MHERSSENPEIIEYILPVRHGKYRYYATPDQTSTEQAKSVLFELADYRLYMDANVAEVNAALRWLREKYPQPASELIRGQAILWRSPLAPYYVVRRYPDPNMSTVDQMYKNFSTLADNLVNPETSNQRKPLASSSIIINCSKTDRFPSKLGVSARIAFIKGIFQKITKNT